MNLFSASIVTLVILSLSTKLTSSISIQFPDHNFAGTSLLADAHLAGGGHSVLLRRDTPSSFGIILRNTPVNFTSATSFSSNFTFEIGNGVALVIVASDFPSNFVRNTSFEILDKNRLLSVEFDANVYKNSFSRVRVSNVSKISNVISEGVKLTSWIDYRASSQRLEVRLSKLGDPKRAKPLISYQINLGKMLKSEEVLFGLLSSNDDKNQRGKITTVYSWNTEIKGVPKWLHSIPIIPEDYVKSNKKESCFLSWFVIVMCCGALAGLVVLFVSFYVADRMKVQGKNYVSPVDFQYEKIGVPYVKNSKTGMK
ncbi:probable L-type lectin-domain containing receptor kinase S.7 [Rutidosis leptorrhynchoides]|uniref:probable L-type lectin-domain containing receptor kinase S.7 n=1 Tax=Rutidosis leptorrhynchoides TaxID=125765 RepID=UPI003A993B96